MFSEKYPNRTRADTPRHHRNDETSASSDTDDKAIKQQAKSAAMQQVTAQLASMHDNGTPRHHRRRLSSQGCYLLSARPRTKNAPVDVDPPSPLDSDKDDSSLPTSMCVCYSCNFSRRFSHSAQILLIIEHINDAGRTAFRPVHAGRVWGGQ